MANLFYSGKMVSDQIDSYLTNGISEAAHIDGELVVLGGLAEDTTYSTTGIEYDTYKVEAPAAGKEVAIIDYAGISEGEINGNVYKIGSKIYGLSIPAGETFRVRRLALHDKFWLGADNFAATPVVGKEYGADADGKHNETPVGDYKVKVLASRELTAGMTAKGLMYFCEVIAL